MWCTRGLTNGGVGVIDLTCIQTATFYFPLPWLQRTRTCRPVKTNWVPDDQNFNWLKKGAVRKYFIELALLKIFTITNKLSLFLANYNSSPKCCNAWNLLFRPWDLRPNIWWWRSLLTSVIHQNWKYNLPPPVANFVYEARWELMF